MIDESVADLDGICQQLLDQLDEFVRSVEEDMGELVLPVDDEGADGFVDCEGDHDRMVFVVVLDFVVVEAHLDRLGAGVGVVAPEGAGVGVVEGIESNIEFGTADEVHADIRVSAQHLMEDCEKMLWQLLAPMARVPLPRSHHTADHGAGETFQTLQHVGGLFMPSLDTMPSPHPHGFGQLGLLLERAEPI